MKPGSRVCGDRRQLAGKGRALRGGQQRRVPQAAQARIPHVQFQASDQPPELLAAQGRRDDAR